MTQPATSRPSTSYGELLPPVPDPRATRGSLQLLSKIADTLRMSAIITVTDAAGRILCRRQATEAEVLSAIAAAEAAEVEGVGAMDRIARERHDADLCEATA